MQTCSFVVKEVTKDSCDGITLDQISSIHQETLEHGFLSSLGGQFLKQIYRELAKDPNSHLVCATHNQVIVGFICGTTNTSVFYNRFLKRNVIYGMLVLFPKLMSFQGLKKIIETLIIPSKTKKISLPSAQLLNFCISKEFQGNGVGGSLFKTLMSWFQSNNISEVTIITGKDQLSAQRFYQKQGLNQQNTVALHDNDESVVYIWDSKSNKSRHL